MGMGASRMHALVLVVSRMNEPAWSGSLLTLWRTWSIRLSRSRSRSLSAHASPTRSPPTSAASHTISCRLSGIALTMAHTSSLVNGSWSAFLLLGWGCLTLHGL